MSEWPQDQICSFFQLISNWFPVHHNLQFKNIMFYKHLHRNPTHPQETSHSEIQTKKASQSIAHKISNKKQMLLESNDCWKSKELTNCSNRLT